MYTVRLGFCATLFLSAAGCAREGCLREQPIEVRVRSLIARMTAQNSVGPHGPVHAIDADLERELWELLRLLPDDSNAPGILLEAVDRVYLGYHSNLHTGFIVHWPYFNCQKAVKLSERIEVSFPRFREDALWTKICCLRVQGLDGSKYPYTDERWLTYDSVRAQIRWKADPAKVRQLCRELIKRFPTGKYSQFARELLERDNILIELPGNWRASPSLIRRP